MDGFRLPRYCRSVATKKTPSSSAGAPEPSGGEEMSFEQAVERLEGIIDRIERGEVGLEESLTEYERGVGLIRRCREILNRAEQRIAELSIDEGDEGAPPASPMDPEADEAPPF